MMEQKGTDAPDLEPAMGSRARVAEVLTKTTCADLPMIRALGPLLDLPADVLVQAYPTRGLGRRRGPCLKRDRLSLIGRALSNANIEHVPRTF